jgi:hypothetical protein
MKKIATIFAIISVAMLPWCARAQGSSGDQGATPKPPVHFYKLNFTLEELNDAGKVTNARSYVETIATASGGQTQQIRTGSRIPIATGAENGSTQFQYIDIGVNFDIRQVQEVGDKLSFFLVSEISSIASQTQIAGTGEPVIRQNRWESMILIPIAKPTLAYSADDLDSKGKMQVELTATRID